MDLNKVYFRSSSFGNLMTESRGSVLSDAQLKTLSDFEERIREGERPLTENQRKTYLDLKERKNAPPKLSDTAESEIEKQLKLRTESRIKQLTDLGIHEDVIYCELGSGQWGNHKNLSETLTDEMWAEHLEWTKKQIEIRNKKQEIFTPTLLTEEDAFKSNESAKENYHEADVDVKGVVKTHDFTNYQEEVQHIEQIPTKSEVTWESIFEEWHTDFHGMTFLQYLKQFYNVPTKKQ